MRTTLQVPRPPKPALPKKVNGKRPERNYVTNVFPFKYPKGEVTMYFSPKEVPFSRKLHESNHPEALSEIDYIYPKGTTVYTTFTRREPNMTAVNIDLSSEKDAFQKHYYRDALALYFKQTEGTLTRKGKVGEVIVLVPDETLSDSLLKVYDKYSLNIAIGIFSTKPRLPELTISYEGKAFFLRRPLSELTQKFSVKDFAWIACGNRLIHFNDIADYPAAEKYELFPSLTKNLRSKLGIPLPPKPTQSRYLIHKEKMVVC